MINGSVALFYSSDKLLRNLYTVGNLCRKHLFTVKASHLYRLVSRYDDTVALCYFLIGKNVLCSA